ncbi:hypothetical protein D3C84_1062440 [compost metagenome]
MSFMKLVTTSKIAPCTAREVAMLCAMLGCRPPVFSSARKSLAAACAQASKPRPLMSLSMSVRTGIEPLLMLKIFWKSLPRATLARSCWAAMSPLRSALSLNTASESML